MDRFRFRVWDPEDKIYTSFPWFAEIHNSRLEVEYPKILEQCTGLKDKHGTLIFEGDIVKTFDGNIGIVKFENAMFSVFQENTYYTSVLGVDEIIGNVHEIK